jgi:hypothetical protein
MMNRNREDDRTDQHPLKPSIVDAAKSIRVAVSMPIFDAGNRLGDFPSDTSNPGHTPFRIVVRIVRLDRGQTRSVTAGLESPTAGSGR